VHNPYLQVRFASSLPGAEDLVVDASRSGPVISDVDGRPLLHLAWRDGAVEMGRWLWWRAVLMLCAAVLLVAACWSFCSRAAKRTNAVFAVALFMVGVLALRWLSLEVGRTAPFDRWPLFDPAVYATSTWFPSLGDLLINAALLVVCGAFMRSVLASVRARSSAWASVLGFALILAYATWVTGLCIDLVNDSNIDLDLFHIQSIGPYGALAFLAMALLFASWLLVAASLVRAISPVTFTRQTVFSFALVLLLSIILHHLSGVRDTILFLWPVPLLVLALWGCYRRFTFLHGVLGVAVIAFTGTHIIIKYMANREQRERAVLAERIAAREDPVIEQLFREGSQRMRTDGAIYSLLTRAGSCDPQQLDALVKQPYFSGYWEKYDVRLFGYGTEGDARCATDLDPPRSADTATAHLPSGVSETPDLFIDDRSGGEVFYHGRIAIMPNDSTLPVQLLVEASPRASHGLGFPELLLAGDDAVTRKLERYAMARYVNHELVEQRGAIAHPQHWLRKLDTDGSLRYEEGDHEFLAQAVGEHTIVVLGLPHRTLLDKATT
ncbi:MAG TPA: hypothetical protein PK760_10700, partial [Flavobacteriales bacterium]|nr:hypothetical protein [Flavobacteriales bacterium]